MGKLKQDFRTPNPDGKVFKEKESWKTTTPLFSITSARMIDTLDLLKPSVYIQHDLLKKT